MRVKAKYSFTGEADVELSFQEDEELEVIDQNVGNGWWSARNTSGKVGIIPKAYVEEIQDETTDASPKSEEPSTNDYTNISSAFEGMGMSKQADTPGVVGAVEDSTPDPYTRRWSIPDVTTEDKTVVSSPVKEVSAQRPPLHPTAAADSDFDDDTEESYSTLSEQAQSVIPQRSRAGTIRSRLFDSKGIESFILHGSRISVNEADICVVRRNELGAFEWEPHNPTITTYEISATTEGSKLAGLKQFTVYYVAPAAGSTTRRGVNRRFKQFDWLHAMLVDKFRLLCIPGLPEKFVTGRFEPELIEARKHQLQLWVNRIASHPVMRSSPAVIQFLNQDLNYNSNLSIKEWKRYKRDTENDSLRGSNWFSCIRNTSTVSFTEADTKIDSFCAFLAQFERSNANLSAQGVKFSEFHAVIGREYSRFAQSFSELGKTFYADCHRFDCKELSSAILAAGKTFHSIAQKLSQPAGFQNLLYSIRDYSTMITSFANPINIQRGLRDILTNMRSTEQAKIPPDVVKRAASINAACLAEVNHFDGSRKQDYKQAIREFIKSQRELYQEIVAELQELENKFT